MFAAIARFDVRFRWLIVAVWVLGVIAAVRTLPSLSSVTQSSNVQFLSPSSPSVQAALLAAPFQSGNPSATAIIVASRESGPLTAADTAVWSRCAANANFTAHERVMAKLREVAGIVSLSPEAVPPFLGSNVWMGRYGAQEQSDADSRVNPWFGFDAVGPDYFRTLGVPVIDGRTFTDADGENAPRVARTMMRTEVADQPQRAAHGMAGGRGVEISAGVRVDERPGLAHGVSK